MRARPAHLHCLVRESTRATWRLRAGELRVYHDVVVDVPAVVVIKAAGIDVRNRVVIGNEEIDLS